MNCYSSRHTWTRSGSNAALPPIAPNERCDCGMWTWAQMKMQEDKLAVILPWLRKHGGHERPCDCADPCSCGWSEVAKMMKETT